MAIKKRDPNEIARLLSEDTESEFRRMQSEPAPDAPFRPVLFFFRRGKDDSVYAELMAWCQKQGDVDISLVSDGQEIARRQAKQKRELAIRSIVIAPILSKADLVDLDHLLSWRQSQFLEMEMQVLVLTRYHTPQLWQYLRARGCLVFLPGFIQVKELKQTLLKTFRLLELASTRRIPEYLAALFLGNSSLPQFRVKWNSALDIVEDWWIVPAERFVYQMNSLWMVILLGPSPKAGVWEGSENTSWRWIPNVKNAAGVKRLKSAIALATVDGVWHFKGKKPQYFGGRWYFIGEVPELYFEKASREKFYKVKVRNLGEVEVAPNSGRSLHRISVPDRPEDATDSGFKEGFEITRTDVGLKKVFDKNRESQNATADDSAADAFNFDKRKNYFSTLNEPEKLIELLRELCEQKAPVSVWVKGDHVRADGHFRLIEEEKLRVALDFTDLAQSSQFSSILTSQPDKKILGFFKSSLGLIFFIVNQFEILPLSHRFVLELRQVLFQVQRRKSARLPVPTEFPLTLQVGQYVAKVVDVSISGFGVIVESEKPPFKAGQSFPVIACWKDEILRLDCEVRWIRALAPEQQTSFQVGLLIKSPAVEHVTQLGLMLFELQSYDGE